MSDQLPIPLVQIMARAGYEYMAQVVNADPKNDPLCTWENQTEKLRLEWIGCAQAMRDAWIKEIIPRLKENNWFFSSDNKGRSE